ncbi:hypothetical protein RB2150_18402 [Rhodobacterales bacterium HTCC2150]|nr:hypothetical protein RB2150_17802 [Rhodobacterales bacterium HTCC2150] [Rhodobacteraceae bacterium HTCC2150]EBA02765.1 hypothetical protein RB2150_17962 [Rhodobacterales bacterium HTCC2150] [Rhodobacteraceae bacterium HTCC2150]EBA02853.1 hypothetical protein RB2150_18402 [Rhodobacterales bacterium HTCC2150] [Rhodobacteraceae bacterium HTCC2150]
MPRTKRVALLYYIKQTFPDHAK